MTDKTLSTLLPIPGWDPRHAGEVEIAGGTDPILPTPFRIGETAAASLAAVGLAVSDLWELRTGRRQEIKVDTRQATASLRSSRYLTMDGAPVRRRADPCERPLPPVALCTGITYQGGLLMVSTTRTRRTQHLGFTLRSTATHASTSPSRPSSSGGTAR